MVISSEAAVNSFSLIKSKLLHVLRVAPHR